ncbi:hypothetical protein HMPREF1157_1337 [Staphylococcus epidermidis E13A]|nr:hypothetical protein UC17_10705 [Staphylococcus epidermidis]EPZ40829.1 hypothetical protein HMPREF1157_1337 [Staphylococcus epidermidis E13A]
MLYTLITFIFLFQFFTKSFPLSLAISLTTLILTMYNIKVISLRRKEDIKTRIFIQPINEKTIFDREMNVTSNFHLKFHVENIGKNSAINLSIDFKLLDSNRYVPSTVLNNDESIKIIRKTTIFPHKIKIFKHNDKQLLRYIFSRFEMSDDTEFKLKYNIKINYFDSNYNQQIQRKSKLIFTIKKEWINENYIITIESQPLLLKF